QDLSQKIKQEMLHRGIHVMVAHLACTQDFSLVTPIGTVSADPGEDIILPVHLSPETSAVFMKIRWVKGAEFIYQYMNGQEKTNSDYENQANLSIQELERGNLSLTLRNVQQTDSGDYTCKVFQEGCLCVCGCYI
uniref:Ig-like domain-containing protein n=1 Tax=Cyprinus carpio TaxID=7962 RepID=A0A8C1JM26_CYPCA